MAGVGGTLHPPNGQQFQQPAPQQQQAAPNVGDQEFTDAMGVRRKVCRMFLNTQTCRFGAACRFAHLIRQLDGTYNCTNVGGVQNAGQPAGMLQAAPVQQVAQVQQVPALKLGAVPAAGAVVAAPCHTGRKPKTEAVTEANTVMTLSLVKQRLGGVPIDYHGLMGTAKAIMCTLVHSGLFVTQLLQKEDEILINVALAGDGELEPELRRILGYVHRNATRMVWGKKTPIGINMAKHLAERIITMCENAGLSEVEYDYKEEEEANLEAKKNDDEKFMAAITVLTNEMKKSNQEITKSMTAKFDQLEAVSKAGSTGSVSSAATATPGGADSFLAAFGAPSGGGAGGPLSPTSIGSSAAADAAKEQAKREIREEQMRAEMKVAEMRSEAGVRMREIEARVEQRAMFAARAKESEMMMMQTRMAEQAAEMTRMEQRAAMEKEQLMRARMASEMSVKSGETAAVEAKEHQMWEMNIRAESQLEMSRMEARAEVQSVRIKAEEMMAQNQQNMEALKMKADRDRILAAQAARMEVISEAKSESQNGWAHELEDYRRLLDQKQGQDERRMEMKMEEMRASMNSEMAAMQSQYRAKMAQQTMEQESMQQRQHYQIQETRAAQEAEVRAYREEVLQEAIRMKEEVREERRLNAEMNEQQRQQGAVPGGAAQVAGANDTETIMGGSMMTLEWNESILKRKGVDMRTKLNYHRMAFACHCNTPQDAWAHKNTGGPFPQEILEEEAAGGSELSPRDLKVQKGLIKRGGEQKSQAELEKEKVRKAAEMKMRVMEGRSPARAPGKRSAMGRTPTKTPLRLARKKQRALPVGEMDPTQIYEGSDMEREDFDGMEKEDFDEEDQDNLRAFLATTGASAGFLTTAGADACRLGVGGESLVSSSSMPLRRPGGTVVLSAGEEGAVNGLIDFTGDTFALRKDGDEKENLNLDMMGGALDLGSISKAVVENSVQAAAASLPNLTVPVAQDRDFADFLDPEQTLKDHKMIFGCTCSTPDEMMNHMQQNRDLLNQRKGITSPGEEEKSVVAGGELKLNGLDNFEGFFDDGQKAWAADKVLKMAQEREKEAAEANKELERKMQVMKKHQEGELERIRGKPPVSDEVRKVKHAALELISKTEWGAWETSPRKSKYEPAVPGQPFHDMDREWIGRYEKVGLKDMKQLGQNGMQEWVLGIPLEVLQKANDRVKEITAWWRGHAQAAHLMQKLLESHLVMWTDNKKEHTPIITAVAICVELQIYEKMIAEEAKKGNGSKTA